MMKTTLALIGFTTLAGCALDHDELSREEPLKEEAEQLGHQDADARHCVSQTVAVPINLDRGGVPAAAADNPRCFSRFAQAIDFATGGRVKLPETATPEDLDEAALSSTALASFVIGVEFQHSNYTGPSYTYASAFTCAEYNHYLSKMPSGWNDTISSARAYSYCNHAYHYEHDYGLGAVVDCGTGCAYIGNAMNDRTSSIRWTQ